jgi:hypothetical protein
MSLEILCCYAQRDQSLLFELKTRLVSIQRVQPSIFWHDINIDLGSEWEQEMIRHVNSAHIIFLLVSPDFLSSHFCSSKGFAQALERQKKGEAQVIPIILRPVDWTETPLAQLQVLPKDAQPVVSSHRQNRDQAFSSLAIEIREVVLRQQNII